MKSYEELMDEIYELPDGDAKIDRLEQAIILADEMQDIRKGYELRDMLANVANFCGYPMKLLVAFSWMISTWEKHPYLFSEHSVLWKYKWILGKIDDFPQISLEKINELYEDMRQKFDSRGASLRPYYFYRTAFLKQNGMNDEVEPFYRLWMDTERGYLSCCPACEQARQASHAIYKKEYAYAIDLAMPLLNGKYTCREQPQHTYATIIKAFVEEKRDQEAAEYAEKASKYLANQRGAFNSLRLVIDYMIDVDLGKAKSMFEKHIRFAIESENPREKFNFYVLAARLMKKLRSRRFKIKFPFRFEKHRDDGNYDYDELYDWFTEQAMQIANAFDQRNGNTYFKEYLEKEVNRA